MRRTPADIYCHVCPYSAFSLSTQARAGLSYKRKTPCIKQGVEEDSSIVVGPFPFCFEVFFESRVLSVIRFVSVTRGTKERGVIPLTT